MSYDLFGDARTALKGSVNRYMAGLTTSYARRYNPLAIDSDDRPWNDVNGDNIAQNSEINFSTLPASFGVRSLNTLDPDMTRPYNLETSAQVQHEVIPGLSVNFGWFRRSFKDEIFTDDLTANPIDYITDTTGYTAISLLMITLAVTPLRRLTARNELIRLRRMLGLLAFFYACLHVSTWLVLDWFFDFASMAADVVERPFITMGMTTFLLLVPLAATSTAGMIRRLGRRWQQLHRLVYIAAVTAVIHFWWVVKADFRQPRLWALALCVLFGFRAWWTVQNRALAGRRLTS